MPDITMCRNNKCSMKKECYRFIAEPDIIQSYSFFTPQSSILHKILNRQYCDSFIPLTEKKSCRKSII